jgi:Flp pilus assembly CpaF family ATPase
MKPTAQPKKGTLVAGGQVQIEIKETDVELMVEESEKMREQIRMQATEVGPILEALLRDTHGQIRWGLNE